MWGAPHLLQLRTQVLALARPQQTPSQAGSIAGSLSPVSVKQAAMPTEGPLSEAGLEVWPRGIYDLVTQISEEYDQPIIEITESGCGYLDGPNEETHGSIPDERRI